MCVSVRRAAAAFVLAVAVGVGSGIHAQTSRFEELWNSGTPVTLTGLLTTIVGDDFASGRSAAHQFIRDDRTGRSFEVHFDQATSAVLTGRRVTVQARAHASDLYVRAAQTTEVTGVSSADIASMTSPPSGDQHTLVIAADFRDATLPCTTASIDAVMFSDPSGQSVNNLYRASSNNRVTFSGQVIGPFLMNVSVADSCNLAGWADALDAQASAMGVDLTTFPRRMYVLPATSCGAAGWGTIGGSPSRSWVLSCGTQGVYPHEIGHNLGMDHASTPTSEYGDNTDPMSVASWMLHGVNAPHRHELGWVDPTSLLVVNESGMFNVAPLAIDPQSAIGPTMLVVLKPDTGDYYYVSYRTRINGDQYIDGGYYSRLSVHRYAGDGSSSRPVLLAGLDDGESFVDSVNGITVRQVAHDATRSVAEIDISQPCVLQAPAVAATPVAQTGPAPATASYQVTVTNSDSMACQQRTFTVGETVPTGWTGTVSSAAATLAPGQSATLTATLAVPATAQPASYLADVAVSGSSNTVTTSMTYSVVAAGDTTAPTAPSRLAATINSKKKQVQLSWMASSDNVGVTGYTVTRNGVAVAQVQTTGWTDTVWTAGASYSYAVVARDAAGNQSASSNVVSVTLPGGTTGSGGSSGGSGGGKKP